VSNEYTFLTAHVQSKGALRSIAQIDMLKDAGSTASTLLKYVQGWFAHELPWHATRIGYTTRPEPTVLATGPDGIVSIGTQSGSSEEQIDDSLEGPARRGPIRDLQLVAGVPYVCGMGRQVYRREGSDHWTRQDAGTVLPLGKIQLCGFNSITGLDEEHLLAVGFNGEIWRRDHGQWRIDESPTNLVLHKVLMIDAELAFASGQLGTLLRNDGSGWKTLDLALPEEDLWDLAWFDQALYIACDSGLFRLDDDRLTLVDLGRPGRVSTRHLHANDGVLMSCGPKHVLWTDDGERWHDITP
jgi:hypothetical protein